MQISSECDLIFTEIVAEMRLTIDYNPIGADRILKLED